jgi:hypothetical protein
MLDLQSPRWENLSHAYGSAADVPAMLEALKAAPAPKDYLSEPWFSLWSALCHQSDVYTASYAAVPHVASIAVTKSPGERLEHIHFIGAVEAYRHKPLAPPNPVGYEQDYFHALGQTFSIISDCLKFDWNEVGYRILLGALAAVCGKPNLGMAIMELTGHCVCSNCETEFAAPGYSINHEAQTTV